MNTVPSVAVATVGRKARQMTITQIQVCVTCKYPTDRAWKSVKDAKYGEIWNETGVCRQCWSSFIVKEDAKAKKAIDPDIQFVLSGQGACYCTDSLICSPCGKDS